jgi:hypothetical protein
MLGWPEVFAVLSGLRCLLTTHAACLRVCSCCPRSFGIMMYEVFTRQAAYARMRYGQIYHQVRPDSWGKWLPWQYAVKVCVVTGPGVVRCDGVLMCTSRIPAV